MSSLHQIEALFHEALALPLTLDRAVWLGARSQGDMAMLSEVSALLDAHAGMKAPAVASTPEPVIPAAQFGAYRAVRLLGRGGMSTVFLAERADGQFQQTVALKVMAAYLAGPEFLHRFETERQLLATLNHNNITRLLDGGVSSTGDPFLITEYVEGDAIDRYCDRHKLDIPARLRIFLKVCDAVDYAHRNLIVHRDLKPGNILVNNTPENRWLLYTRFTCRKWTVAVRNPCWN